MNKDNVHLAMAEARKDGKKWVLPIATANGLREREIVARGTRAIDPHNYQTYRMYPKITALTALVWLFVIIASFIGLVYLFVN